MVRQLSWAYGERGVTAHLVAPGPAETERLRRVATARGAKDGLDTEAVLDQRRAESALGAFTTVAQIAWAIGLRLDPRADALAGSTLFMDAGRRKGLPRPTPTSRSRASTSTAVKAASGCTTRPDFSP